MKLRNKKTGEITDKICIHICSFDVDGNECKEIDTETRSLEKVLEIWEDYKPVEPLIKDEKIRKAVRAWAEAIGEKDDLVVSKNMEYHECCIYCGELGNPALIDLNINLDIEENSYTLTELCGEEEE